MRQPKLRCVEVVQDVVNRIRVIQVIQMLQIVSGVIVIFEGIKGQVGVEISGGSGRIGMGFGEEAVNYLL